MTRHRKPAILALADGSIFRGYAVGKEGETSGEVVFNTSMTGYQEILTDPSYSYQMITFTYPHIGNVGVNLEDVESRRIFATGLIVRELSAHFSNFRASKSLEQYLVENELVGIGGFDTRALVMHVRNTGAQIGIISSTESNASLLVERAKALPTMDGQDLVKDVTCQEPYQWNEGVWEPGLGYKHYSYEELEQRPTVVVVDCGVKYNILRLLIHHGFRVQVVPAFYTAKQIKELNPDALFLSNGPGDPAAVHYVIEAVKQLVGKLPIFGICLGHQILGLALDAPTFKLKFGHRGANHPVKRLACPGELNLAGGKVEITAQNHGFATDINRMPPSLKISHLNLNDRTISGFDVPELKAFSVQYHPEASPGPTDSRYLFAKFRKMVG